MCACDYLHVRLRLSPCALAAYGLQSTPLGCRGTRGAQARTALMLALAGIPLVIHRSTVVKARGYALASFGWQATLP
jgi:hypothetical protein